MDVTELASVQRGNYIACAIPAAARRATGRAAAPLRGRPAVGRHGHACSLP